MRNALYARLVRLSFRFYDTPPDRPADVAGDGRPPGRPLLPRLRPDLLLPEHPRRRLGHGRPLLRPVGARADRARDRPVPRSCSPTGTATSRTRRSATSSRSSPTSPPSRRRASSASTSSRRSRRSRPRRRSSDDRSEAVFEQTLQGEPPARLLRAADLVRADARAGGRAARRRDDGRRTAASRSAASSPSTSTSACSCCRCARSACGSGRRSARPRPASGSSR